MELSVLFADDETLRNLKKTYLGIDDFTDVMAFPMEDDSYEKENRPRMLGDIAISVPAAISMSEKNNSSLEFVMSLLLIHGLLHLVGYDHGTKEEAAAMNLKTLDLLALVGYNGLSSLEWYSLTDGLE